MPVRCSGCYDSFSGPWCENCDRWPCTCIAPRSCCYDADIEPHDANPFPGVLHTLGCVNRCAIEVRCWTDLGLTDLYPCGTTKGHDGQCWIPSEYTRIPDVTQRQDVRP